MKKVYMYLLDTMADWESGYLLQGLTLQKYLPEQKVRLLTAARTREPVRTAGGLTLVPDISLDEINEEDAAALLLIGADTWQEEAQKPVLGLGARLLEKGSLVAAICGATLGLADEGLLDDRKHTSNAPFFLTGLSKRYKGQEYYRDDAAVCDGNLITASSAGSLLWARYILAGLKLYAEETLEAWYRCFATGNVKYFGELMATF